MRSFVEPYPYASNRTGFAPTAPDYVEDVVLAADTLLRVLIPPGARFFIASFDADIRLKVGTATSALALPAATTSDGSGAELNPAARRIPDKLADGATIPTHLCLRGPAAARGSLAFYA